MPLEMLGRTRFPRDRRTALPDHAGALRLLLVPARQERDKSEPVEPTVVPRIRDAGGAGSAATWMSLARDPRRLRTRRAAGLSGANAAGSASDRREAISADADLGDSVLRHRRQPAVAGLLRGDAARRDLRAMCCRCRSNGRASTASATIRRALRRRAPGRARGHAARCRRPTRSSSRCCCAICAERLTVEEDGLRLEFRPTSRLSRQADAGSSSTIRAVETEQSNSTALVDNDYVVKIYPQARAGHQSRDRDRPLPDRGRGLRQYAGAARQRRAGRGRQAAARSRSCMPSSQNQGDAWTVTIAYLDRFVDEQRLLAPSEHAGESEEQVPYLRYMSQIGRRTAEMHLALASRDDIADFAPEPIAPEDVARWTERRRRRAPSASSTCCSQRRDALRGSRPRAGRPTAGAARRPCTTASSALLPPDIDGLKIRHHGDFHLGQMLIVKDDVFIIDFEGEPRRALERAPAQGAGGARRRRPDPLDRLFGHRGAASARSRSRPTSTASSARRWRNGATRRPRRSSPPIARRMTDRASVAGRAAGGASSCSNFFLLEKAFYEIEYELAHRPDWLRVPLTGMLRILSAATAARPHDQTVRRGLCDRRRPPRRSLPLSRPAHRGRQDRGARLPARGLARSRRSASTARRAAGAHPRRRPVRRRAAERLDSATSCAPASATTWSSWRIPTAFRRCCPTSISICSAKAPISGSTTSSARIR